MLGPAEPPEPVKSVSRPLRVSLVIPMRNEEGSIEDLLATIGQQTRPPNEIILVDGGSTDRTVAQARLRTASDPRFRILEVGNATPGRGRNLGIAAATHEWIALTDAGIRLEPEWLEQLADVVARNPNSEVVYGNFEPIEGSRFERLAALAYVPAKQLRPEGRMRGPSIASCLLKRSVWQAVGGFPDLRAAEDLILMENVQKAGFRIGWAPRATVWWQLQPTLGRTFRKFVLYSKHNIWAGRQRTWHHGIARQHLAALLFIALAVFHWPWWGVVPVLGALLRVGKSIWVRREGRGAFWLLNPLRFLGVAIVLGTIDMATFIGWAQAALTRPTATSTPLPAEAQQVVSAS